MKCHRLTFEGFMLSGVLVGSLSLLHSVRAQPDTHAALQPPANPAVVRWDEKQIRQNFERNVRDYLEAAQIGDIATQDAVLDYLRQTTNFDGDVATPQGMVLHAAAVSVGQVYSDDTLSDEAIAARLAAHETAMEGFRGLRRDALNTLEQKTAFSKNLRLRAVLLLLGVGTEAPPIVPLEGLYGLDADNPPRPAIERWTKLGFKPNALRWAVWDDPAHYEARKLWIEKSSMVDLMNDRKLTDQAMQSAMLDFIEAREWAEQDLAALAIPLDAALTNHYPNLKMNLDALLADYEAGTHDYLDRVQAAATIMEAKTSYSKNPRLAALLYMKGGLGGTATILPDRGTEYWMSNNAAYLFGHR